MAKESTVYGVRARAPRPTRFGLVLAFALIAPPTIVFVLGLDLLVGVIVFTVFGVDVSMLSLL